MPRRRRFASPPLDLREQLAEEAARVMAEHGIDDFGLAKRKAAARLGLVDAGRLPTNAEIQQRFVERQRLFDPEAQQERVAKLRRVAAQVMEPLAPFRPKLVGAVLAGAVTPASAVELHVFSDAPEHVVLELTRCGYRASDSARRYRFGDAHAPQIPGFKLYCDGEEVLVMVFSERGAHHAPLSPVDGRPMRRASRAAVLALLAAG
jgi:AcrR family transcriptional regulator